MKLSQMSNYRRKNVSCFYIGEVFISIWKWNWNWLSLLPIIFIFEQCEIFLNLCFLLRNDKTKCKLFKSWTKWTSYDSGLEELGEEEAIPSIFRPSTVSAMVCSIAYLYCTYSRVHISSDTAFFKILKKPSIVQK